MRFFPLENYQSAYSYTCILLLFLLIIPTTALAIIPIKQPNTDNQYLTQPLITGKAKTINQTLSDTEKKWIKQHPKLIVGAEPDWAPFDFVNAEGKYSGIAYDYLSLIAEKTGLKFEIKVGIWSDLLERIRKRQIDILPAAFYTKARSEYVNYSSPYFQALDYFFIRNDLNIKTMADLGGKRVAIPKNYAYAEQLSQFFPKIIIVNVDTFTAAIDAVLENRADMLYDTYASISYALKKEGVNTIIPFKSARAMDSHPIHMISRNDQPVLAAILQKALNSISVQEQQAIYIRWIGFEAQIDKTNGNNLKPEQKGLSLSSKEQTWLNAHQRIRFAGNPNRLPYEAFTDKAEYAGMVSDYLRLIQQKLGINIQIVQTKTWQESLQKFTNGEIDLLSQTLNTEPLTSQKYTQSYISNPVVIVMRDDEKFIENLDQIQNKKIAVLQGYGYVANIIRQYPYIDFYTVSSIQEGLTQVSTGKIDALLEAVAPVSYQIAELGINNIRIVGKTEFNAPLALAVSDNYLPLIPLLNRALNDISPAEKQKIHNLWAGKQTVTVMTDYSLLAKIAGALILLNAISLYWNRKLKNEVQKRLASEREIRLLNERFALATDLVSLGVWQWNVSAGNSLVFDERMFEMYQIPQQQIVSLSKWLSKIHADDRHLIENLPKLADQQHLEFRILRADGQLRYIYAASTRVVDEGNGRIKLFGVNWDITERKQADAQFKTIIDGLPLTVLIADHNGLILLDNPQAQREIADHTSIIGRNTAEFYADPQEKTHILEILQTQGSITQRQVRYKISANETRDCLLSVLPISYKGQSAWLAVIVNITERIKMEQDLAEAKNLAERANIAKSAFLANMSHEIRTPMNAILGFTELLNDQIQEPHLKSYIKTIHSAGYTLLTLINDILDLSKIEAGKMILQKTAVNPHDMFAELGNMFMLSIRKKHLDFILEIDPNIPECLMLDVTRLRQVLFNLIGNAVKFTDKGYVRLRARTSNANPIRSHLDLLIEIEDTGIGIPGNEQESVFTEFTQLETPGREAGTGLGLSISRRLVELMGGNISIKSQPGSGSTFTVHLQQVDVAAIKAAQSSKPNLTPQSEIVFQAATVLVVDDIENNRRLIRENFTGSQLAILEAENGLEAISMAALYDIQLILMDIRMPIMNGYQAAKEIKAFKAIPIIALTASVMQDDFERIQCDYFDAYLKKPILRQELIMCLSQFLPHQLVESLALPNQDMRLSAAELRVLPMVIQKLNLQIENWKLIQDSNNISAMKQFAGNLLTIAQEYQFDPLQQYAENLHNCISHFDINGITAMLREFPELHQRLQLAQE